MPEQAQATLFARLRESELLEPAQLEDLARLPEAKDPTRRRWPGCCCRGNY